MTRSTLLGISLACLILSACAAGISSVALTSPLGAKGSFEKILIVTNRQPDLDDTIRFNGERNDTLSFADASIWVPQNRLPGEMRYPYGRIDPNRHFATVAFENVPDSDELITRINQKLLAISDPAERRVILFIHGYNVDFGEGMYRHAQMTRDFAIRGAAVHFSWPSAGEISRYLYDRDSAHFSRDALVETLDLISQTEATSIMLFAHSMGTFLSMETLRQLSQTGREDILDKIDPLVLASPDIDMDVFRAQISKLSPTPPHIITLVSKRDTVLTLSERLRGGHDSVGKGDQIRALQALGVTVIDMTDLTDTYSTAHNTFAESPTLLALFQDGQLQRLLDGAKQHETRDTSVGALSDLAASIIYLPARVLGDR